MQRLRQLLSQRNATSRKLQASLDFAAACPLLELHEAQVTGRLRPEEAQAAFERSVAKWRDADLGKAIAFANDAITIQLAEMTQHVADLDAGDAPLPAAPPIQDAEAHGSGASSAAFSPSIGPSSHTNPGATLKFAMKALYADEGHAADARYRHMLSQRVGFSLWLGPSQAPTPDAAAGVYVHGHAPPGSVVGLFAGVVYNGEMLRRPSDAGHLGNPARPRRLIPRFDEALIDVSAEPEGGGSKANPYALGAHVRHPPKGLLPNTARLQFDFMASPSERGGGGDLLPFPPALRRFIPNGWGADVSTGQQLYAGLEAGVWMKGMVLIALRPLWNEELFVDWALNPAASNALRAAGGWYHELDADANARIWRGITT